MVSATALVELDRAALAGPVRAALGRDDADILAWERRLLRVGPNPATGGVYRVAGTARIDGATVPWALILKVVRAAANATGDSADPAGPYYWRREPLLYRSGALADLPDLRAPRCYGVADRGPDVAWLWLEEVRDEAPSPWSVDRYGWAARQLGRFNGAYLAGRPLPASSALSRGWHRAATDAYAPAYTRFAKARAHPLLSHLWLGDAAGRTLALLAGRERLLAALDRLPQTFCHLDASPANLLVERGADGAEALVAVDWALAGVAPLGADLASLVIPHDLAAKDVRAVAAVAFAGYCSGLRDAGWRGDRRLVRLGYAASAALCFGLMPMGVWLLDERLRAADGWEEPGVLEDFAYHRGLLQRCLLDLADEASALLGNLGLDA